VLCVIDVMIRPTRSTEVVVPDKLAQRQQQQLLLRLRYRRHHLDPRTDNITLWHHHHASAWIRSSPPRAPIQSISGSVWGMTLLTRRAPGVEALAAWRRHPRRLIYTLQPVTSSWIDEHLYPAARCSVADWRQRRASNFRWQTLVLSPYYLVTSARKLSLVMLTYDDLV